MTRALATIVGATALVAAASLGCTQNTGSKPPVDRFFFPSSLALHRPPRAAGAAQPDADFLYVVNADFDLAYNGSTIVAVNLTCVRNVLHGTTTGSCRDINEPNEPPRPYRCVPDPNSLGGLLCSDDSFIRRSFTRKLNPYAVESTIGRYGGGATQRLYVVVRGGNALAWFDIDSQGKLDCGTLDGDGYCAADHLAGNDPGQSPTSAQLPIDPSSISVDEERGWVVISHQGVDATTPHASLFRDPVYAGASAGQATHPVLLNVVGGISTGLSSLALLPRGCADVPAMGATPAVLCPERSTWFSTSRTEATFTLLQAYPGNAAFSDNRAFLYRSAVAPVLGLNTGADSRAVVLDPEYVSNPAIAVKRAYVTSRRPESLLTVDLSNASVPVVTDVISLPSGPSRLAAVRRRPAGATVDRTLVYVSSFDARWISVVDPAEHLILERIPANRGPHQMVYDENEGLLYVVDFLDAAVEVIDVRPSIADPANPAAPPVANPHFNRRLLTLGGPGRAP